MSRNIKQEIKNYIRNILLRIKLKSQINETRKKYGYCVMFISVPTHGNLGDQAIVYAQYKLFESIGIKNNIIEIRSCDYLRFANVIENYITEKDLIVVDGGGNMGTLWMEEELRIRDIVKRFKNNKVIIFPETIYYSDDNFGNYEFEKSKKVYKSHNNLHICVRDNNSYNLIKEKYKPAKVKYVPDIVLYLNELSLNKERKDALLCIRKDKEKVTDDNLRNKIESYLDKRNMKVKYTSTVIDKTIRKKHREDELYKKWNEFASAKIVITDRLHGMIFSAITGTPCIALNNSNGKVKGVYEWIKELPYIIFCDDSSNIEESIDKLLDIEYSSYKEFRDKKLIKSFNPIIQMIKQ